MGKSIEVDEAALTQLKAARRDGESWSDVIKRYVRPRPTLDQVLHTLRKSALSLDTLETLDETISRRRRKKRSRKA